MIGTRMSCQAEFPAGLIVNEIDKPSAIWTYATGIRPGASTNTSGLSSSSRCAVKFVMATSIGNKNDAFAIGSPIYWIISAFTESEMSFVDNPRSSCL